MTPAVLHADSALTIDSAASAPEGDATGLELSIGGPITLRLGLWPGVTTGDLVLGDAAQDPLLLVDSLRAKIGLGALLRGRIHVLELGAQGIAVDYCSPFPEFPERPDTATEDSPPPSVAVDDVTITGVSVRCGPSPGADPLELSLEQIRTRNLVLPWSRYWWQHG